MEFWKGLIVGGDDKASMAKAAFWLAFAVFLASWFPPLSGQVAERHDLIIILDSLLVYVLGGKAVWTGGKFAGRKRGGPTHEQP